MKLKMTIRRQAKKELQAINNSIEALTRQLTRGSIALGRIYDTYYNLRHRLDIYLLMTPEKVATDLDTIATEEDIRKCEYYRTIAKSMRDRMLAYDTQVYVGSLTNRALIKLLDEITVWVELALGKRDRNRNREAVKPKETLTNNPAEWKIYTNCSPHIYQSKIRPSCFSSDGLTTYYDIEEHPSVRHKLMERK